MNTILQNKGNRNLFNRAVQCDKRKAEPHGFTVNAWGKDTGKISFDAGFYFASAGQYEANRYACAAKFKSGNYKEGVAYRVRVYPKHDAASV